MKAFLLKISSPEGDMFRGDIVKLCVRGTEGDLAVMAGHIPFVSYVKPFHLVALGFTNLQNRLLNFF